jgi:hypothetical protein
MRTVGPPTKVSVTLEAAMECSFKLLACAKFNNSAA